MEYILRTQNLTKKYNGKPVVKDINMHIRPGEIYGFLGQNGAGKTTTIRMLTGLIKPTSGSIQLFGEDIRFNHKKVNERIGSIIEFPGFYPNLTAYENLDLHRRLMGVVEKKTIKEVLELVGLREVEQRKTKNLSLGMKQRLGIARALLHHPEMLILDEPTNGLDPTGIKEVRQLIANLAEEQKITILISSHILSEIQQMATKVGIIHQGVLIREVDFELIEKENRHYLQIKVDNDKKAAQIVEEHLKIREYSIVEPGTIRIYEQFENPGNINKLLVNNQITVNELQIVKDTLEDYFVNLTGGEMLNA